MPQGDNYAGDFIWKQPDPKPLLEAGTWEECMRYCLDPRFYEFELERGRCFIAGPFAQGCFGETYYAIIPLPIQQAQ